MNFVIDVDLKQNLATLRGENYTYKYRFTDLIRGFKSNNDNNPTFKAFKKNIDTETEAYIKLVEPDLHEYIFPEKYPRKDVINALKNWNKRSDKSIFDIKTSIRNKTYR